MRVRPFKPGDETELAKIFFAAVREIASAHYSDQQVRAWAPQVPAANQCAARAIDGRTLLVATDEYDSPLAYGDLEPVGHIDHFYCRPEVAGTGVAAALYEAIEAAARRDGIGLLFVEASEPARRFFLKRGFEMIARRDVELRNAPIHNFRMEKRLGEVSGSAG